MTFKIIHVQLVIVISKKCLLFNCRPELSQMRSSPADILTEPTLCPRSKMRQQRSCRDTTIRAVNH